MPQETPLAFGLHPNAEIGYRTHQCNDLFETLLQMQPRNNSAGGDSAGSTQGGPSRSEQVRCVHQRRKKEEREGTKEDISFFCLGLLRVLDSKKLFFSLSPLFPPASFSSYLARDTSALRFSLRCKITRSERKSCLSVSLSLFVCLSFASKGGFPLSSLWRKPLGNEGNPRHGNIRTHTYVDKHTTYTHVCIYLPAPTCCRLYVSASLSVSVSICICIDL